MGLTGDINGAARAAEAAARDSYGRLVAYLSARSRDVAAAEDALGEAFRAALETWPRDGVPQKPEAWLLSVARREMIDESRHERVRIAAEPTLRSMEENRRTSRARAGGGDEEEFPDKRLELLFVCAHNAIDAAARTPLMLQVILGLDAARIASAFLVAPSTMSQRLVRAKSRIREARIPFERPSQDELPDRLPPVLEAVYAAYGTGWDDSAGIDPRRMGLAEEAIFLARLLVRLVPAEPEARGLLSLLLHCEARRAARRSPSGDYVPLTDQDVTRWSLPMIAEAERELAFAASMERMGRFQLEAAIQSAHAQRAFTGTIDWAGITLLYEGLVSLAPTLGARVGQAAAHFNTGDPHSGLSILDAIDHQHVCTYQPYWAVRAHLLAELGDFASARVAYSHAIGLTEDPKVREFLIQRRDYLAAVPPQP
jgi:RNA polymerase sigma-70 factor (ECF subfamily)